MESKEEQISTKEFLISVFNYFNFLGRNWQLILIAILLGTCFDCLRIIFTHKEKTYTGSIKFHLDLEGGAQNQLSGFASAFGIGGGTQGGNLLGATNFEAIMLSVNVFNNALLKEINIDGKQQLFVNYFIEKSDISRNEWAGSLFGNPSPNIKFRFNKKKISELNPEENTILTEIYTKLIGLTIIEPEEKSSLINIYATTTDENLTKVWLETLMECTEEFYKEMKTKKTKQILKVQENRLDSLAYLMKHNDGRIARLKFENPNVVDPNGLMREQRLERDNSYISTQYYSQLTNVENLNRLIIEQTPIFTILEPIRLPLTVLNNKGLPKGLTGLIAAILVVVFISLRKTYLDIMV